MRRKLSSIRSVLVDLPVFAGVLERRFLGPQLQDDVERLAGHFAVLPGVAVDVEHRPVARQAAGGDAEIEPALRHVVEHGDPVGELRRMVVGQQEAAGGEPDVACVSISACAISRSGAGCGSHGAVWCSPIQPSLKPSSSAQRRVCRSHRGHRRGRTPADAKAS